MLQEVKSQKLRVKSREGGQVLLIVILIIIVSLTIGLSLASRGIINLRTSTEEADSQEALAVAEAEIEKRLQDTQVGTFTGAFSPTSSYSTIVSPQGGNTFLLNGGSLSVQGEGADVWLADHNADGSINYGTVQSPRFFYLYWGASSEVCVESPDASKWPAAVEAIVFSGTSATNVTTTRYAYDPCSTERENNFSSTNPSNNKDPILASLRIRTDNSINITNGIFVRVIPVYKSTIIGVSACNPGGQNCTSLPSQGFQISSTGTAGSANRKINVFKGYQQTFLPYISYGLFVPTR